MPVTDGSQPRFPLAWGGLLLLALAAIGLFAWVAWQRVPYPFELEWMEGAMVDHAARVRAGLDLYVAPGPDHVQFLYTPLYFHATAMLANVLGDGFLAARLVGLTASLLSALLLGHWVRRETGRVAPGVVAIGLLFAGSPWIRWWLDLARNDSLFVLFVLLTGYLLRFGGGRAAIVAGATATLAFLAKQTAVLWLPAIAVGALLLDWRRGLRFVGAAAVLAGATVGAYHALTDGWFTFFVFEMPRGHGIQADRKLGFWNEDLVPIAPAIGLGLIAFGQFVRAGRAREGLFLAAFASGGLVASYVSRLHAGGFDNVLLYGFVGACLLAPVAAARAATAAGARLALGLLALQFVLLVVDVRSLWQTRPVLLCDPQNALPATGHRQANEELLGFLRQQQGDVFVLSHGHLAAMAGKPPTAHGQAIYDLLSPLLQPEGPSARSQWQRDVVIAFHGRFVADLQAKRFAAIVLDQQVGAAFEGVFGIGLAGNYRRRDTPLLTEGSALQPPIGMITHSPYVLEPIR